MNSLRYYAGSCTDIGLIREVNQDAIYMRVIGRENESIIIGAIFDGIGGMQHSEKASTVVKERLDEWGRILSEWIVPADADKELIFSQVCDVVDVANEEILELWKSDGIRAGTTATIVICTQAEYLIYHIGDSKCSIIDSKGYRKLTVDDTVVGYKNGRQKVFLANYLGKSDTLRFSRYEGKLEKNSMLLFGSDGFFNTFSDDDAMLMRSKIKVSPESIAVVCREFVSQAMERGETDNISVGAIYAI